MECHLSHVRSTSALAVAVAVAVADAFTVAVAVVSTKCNGVLRSWRREGEAPKGCCYFASEAMPFTPFFVLAAELGVFLIRNDAGT